MRTKQKELEEKFSSQIYIRCWWHLEVQFTATSSTAGGWINGMCSLLLLW